MYIVRKGHLDVTVNNHAVACISKGDMFGEQCLVSDEGRRKVSTDI